MSACLCSYLCSCLSSVCLSLNTSFVRILVSSFLDPRVPWQNNPPQTTMEFAAGVLALIRRDLSFVEFAGEFCGLASVTELHDAAILHLFRLGAKYQRLLWISQTLQDCVGREGNLPVFLSGKLPGPESKPAQSVCRLPRRLFFGFADSCQASSRGPAQLVFVS